VFKLIFIDIYIYIFLGGIFIMYNYSRLCQVWKAYEKGVIENYYESLPDIGAVNFGLLTSKVSDVE